MTRWRILAIDDDPGTLEVLTMALEDSYDVITLSNPIEALDVAKIFEPDLIILDLMMPRVDGFHLLDVFRREKFFKNTPIIILSAKRNKRDIQYGYQVGANLYLTKPFQPSRLRRNIDFLFEHNPPPKKVKHLTFQQVFAQIKLLRCFKEGFVGASRLAVSEIGSPGKSGESKEKSSEFSSGDISKSSTESSQETTRRPGPDVEEDRDTPWID